VVCNDGASAVEAVGQHAVDEGKVQSAICILRCVSGGHCVECGWGAYSGGRGSLLRNLVHRHVADGEVALGTLAASLWWRRAGSNADGDRLCRGGGGERKRGSENAGGAHGGGWIGVCVGDASAGRRLSLANVVERNKRERGRTEGIYGCRAKDRRGWLRVLVKLLVRPSKDLEDAPYLATNGHLWARSG